MACLFRFFVTVLAVLALGACASTSVPSGTFITAEYFEYATVIEPPTDGSPGGWRAVCIRAHMGQSIAASQGAHWDSEIQCDLEFGSPIVNRELGYIPLRMAQGISANVANTVAYEVLSQSRGVTSTTCKLLRVGMTAGMNTKIGGSRVTECGVTRWHRPVPEVIWPPVH
jgi:hypothetical protein